MSNYFEETLMSCTSWYKDDDAVNYAAGLVNSLLFKQPGRHNTHFRPLSLGGDGFYRQSIKCNELR